MPRRTHPRVSRSRVRPRVTEGGNYFNSLDGSLFCPCGKMSAHSEEEAWRIAMGIYRARGGDMPQRVYECDVTLGAFHWTRRP